MTSGIYRLTFSENEHYIGKSINMEKRLTEHIKNMRSGKAAAKMHNAYRRFGIPKADILIKVHPDHLDLVEKYYILALQPSLNTTVSDSINHYDFELLQSDPEFLLESSVEHVRRIVAGKEDIERLEAEVELLLEGYELPTIYKDQISMLEDSARRAESLLRWYKELPWYKRIFI